MKKKSLMWTCVLWEVHFTTINCLSYSHSADKMDIFINFVVVENMWKCSYNCCGCLRDSTVFKTLTNYPVFLKKIPYLFRIFKKYKYYRFSDNANLKFILLLWTFVWNFICRSNSTNITEIGDLFVRFRFLYVACVNF